MTYYHPKDEALVEDAESPLFNMNDIMEKHNEAFMKGLRDHKQVLGSYIQRGFSTRIKELKEAERLLVKAQEEVKEGNRPRFIKTPLDELQVLPIIQEKQNAVIETITGEKK